jgi:putative (di)nucleoside polyphosphate hydrolase
LKAPAQYFRAGAGALIIDAQGRVLALERADKPGAWQLPQGGLDKGEEPLKAVLREIEEETGIAARDLELIDTYPTPLAYELPAALRSEKTGRGQAQYWFLFRFTGREESIDLSAGGELRAWKWLRFAELLEITVEFRRALYAALLERFRVHLA